MDYNADPDLMFSNLQAVDGYNWASNISWAQVGPANSVPVAYDISQMLTLMKVAELAVK